MKKLILTVVFLLICSPVWAETYTVEEVIDGATLKLTNGEEVRLIGIKAPEDDKMGQAATEFVKGLIPAKKVRLEFDVDKRDKYGRLLAYVYIHMNDLRHLEDYKNFSRLELFLNAEIIRKGYASPMTIPPNVKYADLFKKLHEEAREQKRGLWKQEAVKGFWTAREDKVEGKGRINGVDDIRPGQLEEGF